MRSNALVRATRSLRGGLAFAALAALTACKSKPKPAPEAAAPAAANGPAPAAESSVLPGSVSARPHLIRANDIESIKHFLQTVDTVKGATFDVTWAPGTVTLDRETTIRSLRGVSEDGGTIRFDGSEGKLKDVKPGVVLLVWGIALRKVSAVDREGDTLIVQTEPVALADAIVKGTIAWSVDAINTQQAFVTRLLPSAGMPPPPGGTGMVTPRGGLSVRDVAYRPWDRQDGGGQGGNEPGPQPGAAPGAPGLPNAPEVEPPTEDPDQEFEGELGAYVYKIGFASQTPGTVDLTLDVFRTDQSQGNATREEANKKAMEKYGDAPRARNTSNLGKPYATFNPSDLLDLRVNAKAHIVSGASSGRMTFAGGRANSAATVTNHLSGYVNFKLIARVGATPTFMEKFKLQLPVSYNVPLYIAGIPFMGTFAANLIVRPALSSRHATATGEYYVKFGGTEGVTAGHGNLSGDGSITDDDNVITDGDLTGVGISALQVSLQLPKIGLGLGFFNTGAMLYVDNVLTGSMITEGAGGIAMVPCKEWSLNAVWSAGTAAQVMGLTLYDAKMPIWTLTPVMHHSQPPGLNCHALG